MFPNSLLGLCDFFRSIVANVLPLEILIITPFSSAGQVVVLRIFSGQSTDNFGFLRLASILL